MSNTSYYGEPNYTDNTYSVPSYTKPSYGEPSYDNISYESSNIKYNVYVNDDELIIDTSNLSDKYSISKKAKTIGVIGLITIGIICIVCI